MNRVLVFLSVLASACAGAATPVFSVSHVSVGGDGGHDYIVAEPGTGRVFISRGTHVMVVDGPSGRVLGDIADTPRVHGVALVERYGHGFTTNGGDSTVSMFDLKTLAVLKRIPVATGGLDGIMYDASTDRIVLTNHSRPGTVAFIDPSSGDVVGTVPLADDAPEGSVSDATGHLFVNNEGASTVQVIDQKTLKPVATWPLAPCVGPTGIAFDARNRRLFSGCSGTSVVLDVGNGHVVATIANGNGVDALGWDPAERLLYIPAGRDGTVTVVHQDSADRYTTLATLQTAVGCKTITVDPVTHTAYLLALEFGPLPANAPTAPAGRPPARGPVVGAQLFAIHH